MTEEVAVEEVAVAEVPVEEVVEEVVVEPKPKKRGRKKKAAVKKYVKFIKGEFRIGRFVVPKEFSLTDEQLADDNFMKRLTHAIKCGHIDESTD